MLIRVPRDQRSFDSSPGIIAVFHALHRLLAPRHPPHALSSLAALIDPLSVLMARNKIKLRYLPVRAFGQDCVTKKSFVISNDAYREYLNFQQDSPYPHQ